MEFRTIEPPASGSRLTREDGRLVVPDDPIVPFIEGDGVGPETWRAARPVLDAAVTRAYGGQRAIHWFEILAGQKARDACGEWLPSDTVEAIRHFLVALKGPLDAPTDGSTPGLDVRLRLALDLYAGMRPVRWLEGAPSPVRHPEKLDVVLFRECTEDIHSGLEWAANSAEAEGIIDHLQSDLGTEVTRGSAIGVKAVSRQGSERLVRMALEYALERGRSSLTLVHSAEVMRHTEGGFRAWGYQLANDEFAEKTITFEQLWSEHEGARPENRVVIKDRPTNTMFQQVLQRPDDFSVIAATNVNGAQLADAMTAQVGGVGLAPGALMGDEAAIFEATHPPDPDAAGQDRANPGSLVLSGAMLLEHLGWSEAARMVTHAVQGAIKQKRVTADLERQMSGATLVSCSEFGQVLVDVLEAD